ncbi:TPA: sensor histidine kinase, partial [Clostridioides difficile]|nr:sensor histidine kinase [Clostridioides difficile]
MTLFFYDIILVFIGKVYFFGGVPLMNRKKLVAFIRYLSLFILVVSY